MRFDMWLPIEAITSVADGTIKLWCVITISAEQALPLSWEQFRGDNVQVVERLDGGGALAGQHV